MQYGKSYMRNDFTTQDYLKILQEIEYHNYCIMQLDEGYLPHAQEIVLLQERVEYLEELLNLYRATVRRDGFTLLQGGKA